MPLAQDKNQQINGTDLNPEKKDIEPNLRYDKYSFCNQREENALFNKLGGEDKENVEKP